MKRVSSFLVLFFWLVQFSNATTYYVDINGNDATGDGSSAKPWRTLAYAISKVPSNQNHTIKLSAGTFIEGSYIQVPTGVNIEGAGRDATTIKASSNLYYATPTYGDKTHYLISLKGGTQSTTQTIRNFGIDGDEKKLYGGILVNARNRVLIQDVKIVNTYYAGIRLWTVQDSRVSNAFIKDCSWGSDRYCMGALIIGDIERVEIDNCYIDEGVGYGVKADPP